ncbi:asparagine--tRNA ligase [Luteolibacter sp. GHJ8]|uniref:Asparagine--tRNA ligase n=1 Tax=Luteolibacter rhizosphaerae TaxID=2989719 RepID=A0ABT3FZK1_9BACT|nr:asparagine--tRNA ligase [Luteolibacter rhizosphaerae]MCW1912395.1 asparagine--tRNA ligase [Luteolibacter rhizosphaerae]
MRSLIRDLLASAAPADSVQAAGWVRTRRDSKAFSFVSLNDGSCLGNLQVIADVGIPGSEDLVRMSTGASVAVEGKLIPSQGGEQAWELQATSIRLLGEAPEDFPLQKKGHSPEFLRSIAHLRPRTNLYGAMFRVRSRMSHAVHRFFAERSFYYVHTPIITASDCEGAGEMFRVTTIDPLAGKAKSYGEDFFGKAAHLTVSGQLEGELFATALGNIYTFGPTFRAENSNTSRHAAEFWMIEPEMAFCDLQGDMDLAEAMVKYLVREALDHQDGDLSIFEKFVDKGLRARLEFVADNSFERISYTDAVEILKKSGKSFEYPVEYGLNLQSEHERWLTEEHFKKPTTIFNYPKEIKPFYMRLNDDDKTVTAMDLLVPGIGEIVGGSQREERLDVLLANMERHGLSTEDYSWYIDTRKYGSVPHAGFGMGFERMLMFVTGMQNIRDVIPFVRTPGQCEF